MSNERYQEVMTSLDNYFTAEEDVQGIVFGSMYLREIEKTESETCRPILTPYQLETFCGKMRELGERALASERGRKNFKAITLVNNVLGRLPAMEAAQ